MPTAPDGQILITQINGGVPPYQYIWGTGEMEDSLMNLTPGTYSLTVMDGNDCENSFSFVVDFISKIDLTHINGLSMQLIPNPVSTGSRAMLQIQDRGQNQLKISIFNAIGQLFYTDRLPISSTVPKYLYQLPNIYQKGCYFIKLENEKGEYSFIKMIVD